MPLGQGWLDCTEPNLRLEDGCLIVDGGAGALHECCHGRWLGPPKTASSARTVSLPPFLRRLAAQLPAPPSAEFVLTTESGTWLWRSTFNRRVLRPAVDGNLAIVKPKVRTHLSRQS